MVELRMGHTGEITLPEDLRNRYRLSPETPIRVIETRNGILLIPQSDAPMSAELAKELEDWQFVSAQAWALFPYETEDE